MGTTNPMSGINPYGRELSQEDIDSNLHRNLVGGMWESLGRLQFDFLRDNGLLPQHKMVDIGCGALRGGIHFVDYLDTGNYFGLDVNRSLIEAGKAELEKQGISAKSPHFIITDRFDLREYAHTFDFAVSISLFTHLPMNHIIRCLKETAAALKSKGVYFASFFEAPSAATLEPLRQSEKIVSHFDADPFHYAYEEIVWMAATAGLKAEYIGDWGHPRNQKMVKFTAV